MVLKYWLAGQQIKFAKAKAPEDGGDIGDSDLDALGEEGADLEAESVDEVEESEEEITEEDDESQEESEEDEYLTLAQMAREMGYEVEDDEDDSTLAQRLLQERAQYQQDLQQHQQELSQMKGLLSHLDQMYNRPAVPQQPFQPQQPAAPPNPYGVELPEYDPSWLNLLTRDEEGNVVAVPGADPELPRKVQSYQQARERAIEKLLRNPTEVMVPAIREQVSAMINQAVGTNLSAFQAQYEAETFLNKRRDLFELDESGQSTGRFNEDGVKFGQYLHEAAGRGIYRQDHQIAYASQQLERDRQYRQSSEAATKEESGNKKRLKTLKRAAGTRRGNSRGQSVTHSKKLPQDAGLTFEQQLANSFKQAGFDPSDKIDMTPVG